MGKKNRTIIYQVLVRLFGNKNAKLTPLGSIEQNGCGKMADFTPSVLANIKSLGATHVWYTGLIEHATQTKYEGIMPDHHALVKGKAGSPYAIKDYYDICPDLATNPQNRKREFNSLVSRTHKAGLKVIIDFVPNHVARQYCSDSKPRGVKDFGTTDNTSHAFDPQNNFYYILNEPLHTQFDTDSTDSNPYVEYPAKATGNDRFDSYPNINDWYETVKLNYGVDYCGGHSLHFEPIPDTWHKMLNILLYWAGKGVDGFRCDMAEMVPCKFWQWAIAKVKIEYPEIIFIAEIYNSDAYRDYIKRGGFDYLYDKVGLYDTLRAIVCGHAPAGAITGTWQSIDDIRSNMLGFLENHDEQRIASDFFAGDAYKAIPALVVGTCMGDAPYMIYAGQELGERGMDEEGFSGRDGRTTIFDYWSVSTLRRMLYQPNKLTAKEKTLREIYSKILNLCNSEEALRTGKFFDLMYANYGYNYGFNPDKHYAFLRKSETELLLIVANFADTKAYFGINIPSHAFDYLDLHRGLCSAYDILTGENSTIDLRPDAPIFVNIPANGAVIIKIGE